MSWRLPSGNIVNFSLLTNPSNLVSVDPAVAGKTHEKQFFTDD